LWSGRLSFLSDYTGGTDLASACSVALGLRSLVLIIGEARTEYLSASLILDGVAGRAQGVASVQVRFHVILRKSVDIGIQGMGPLTVS